MSELVFAQTEMMEKPKNEEQIFGTQLWVYPDLSEDELLNDDAVQYVYGLLVNLVSGSGWTLQGNKADIAKAQPLLTEALSARGWEDALQELIGTRLKRNVVIEVVYENWIPCKYNIMPRNGYQLILDRMNEVEAIHIYTSAGSQTLPLERSIVSRWKPSYQFPKGQTLLTYLKKRIEQKQDLDEASVEYVKTQAVASVLGKYPEGASPKLKDDMHEALRKFQRLGVLTLPKNADVSLLESSASSGIAVVIDLLKQHERRIARMILGAVLQLFESEYGTRAQASVHLEIMQKVIQSYQKPVEDVVQCQLIDRLLKWHFADDLEVNWKLNAPTLTNVQELADAVASLFGAGLLTSYQQDVEKAFLPLLNIDEVAQTRDEADAEKAVEQSVSEEQGGPDVSGATE